MALIAQRESFKNSNWLGGSILYDKNRHGEASRFVVVKETIEKGIPLQPQGIEGVCTATVLLCIAPLLELSVYRWNTILFGDDLFIRCL